MPQDDVLSNTPVHLISAQVVQARGGKTSVIDKIGRVVRHLLVDEGVRRHRSREFIGAFNSGLANADGDLKSFRTDQCLKP